MDEDRIKDIYSVWFQYLIRTDFFHFAVCEDELVSSTGDFPSAWFDKDGKEEFPYTPERMHFLKHYERYWWLDRVLRDYSWSFDDFWSDRRTFILSCWEKYSSVTLGGERGFRFVLPTQGRRWGPTVSDRHKRRLNSYVMSRRFTAGQIFSGGVLNKYFTFQDNSETYKALCLPFPDFERGRWERWRPNYKADPFEPVGGNKKYRSAPGRWNDFDAEVLKQDIRFAQKTLEYVQQGWFPAPPLK